MSEYGTVGGVPVGDEDIDWIQNSMLR